MLYSCNATESSQTLQYSKVEDSKVEGDWKGDDRNHERKLKQNTRAL